MVGSILRLSMEFSYLAWLIMFLIISFGGTVPYKLKVEEEAIVLALLIAPAILGLIVCGLIYCLHHFTKSREQEPSKPAWKNATFSRIYQNIFPSVFDSLCPFCFGGAIIYTILMSPVDFSFGTTAILYIIACFLIPTPDTGNSSFDLNGSEKISKFKIYLLSLILTPAIGYIAVRIYAHEREETTAAINLHLERAKVYFEKKDYINAALECLNGKVDWMEIDRGTSEQRKARYEILLLLAEIQCLQKQYMEAEWTYKKAMMISPEHEHPGHCVREFLWHTREGEDREAAFHVLQVIEDYEKRYSDDDYFTKERIRLSAMSEGYDVAIAEYGKLIASNPQDTSNYIERAKIYLEKKDYANALADYDKVIGLNPQKAWAYQGRADIYLKRKDYDKALADYSKAIELEPQWAWAYYERAQIYFEQKDYDNAIADCTKALESHHPQSELFYISRADAYFEQKDYTNALVDYAKAIRLNPKLPAPYVGRAKIYLEQKDFVSAIADCTRAIEINPGFGEAYSVFADIYASQGQFPEAVANCTKAIEGFSIAEKMPEEKRNEFLSKAYRKRGAAHQKLDHAEQAEADFAKAEELSVPLVTTETLFPKAEKRIEEPINAAEEAVCPNCGAALKEESKFCSKCGTSIAGETIVEERG